MNTLWLGLLLALCILLSRAVRSTRRHRGGSLGVSFDFDHYKAREIASRGVFDKTKWL